MPIKNKLAYYFAYQGRISRSEFWLRFQLPALALVILAAVLFFIEYPNFFTFFSHPPPTDVEMEAILEPINNPVVQVIGVILQIVQFAVSIALFFANMRRLHDRDHSAWFMLIALIPLVGPIWLLVEVGFLKGTDGPNRYGPDPVGRYRHAPTTK